MKLSVLICTYKRKKLLESCLTSLIDDVSQLPDEIIIVDGEDGAIKDLIDKWKEKFPNIKYIPTKNINLAVSRNIGLNYCSGDIIAFTDDDCIVEKRWIEKIKKLHIMNQQIAVIGGRVESREDKFIDRVANLVIFPSFDKPCYVRTIAGANVSYKKDIVEKIGKFDESFFRGEDVDFNWRVLKLGYKIYYEPNLIVYHWHRNTWRSLFYQLFMYGRAYYLVRKKWPDMYCVYPHGIKKFKDFLKLINFFISVLYEPLFLSLKIKGIIYKIISYPFFIFCNISWKLGMIKEMVSKKINNKKSVAR